MSPDSVVDPATNIENKAVLMYIVGLPWNTVEGSG